MAAVTPYIVPLETITDVEKEKTWKSVSLFVRNNKQQKMENSYNKIEPKRKMTIAEGLHPLMVSMRLFGLYVNRRSEDSGDDLGKKSGKWNAHRIYAVTIVILLWINVVRMFSVFTQEDEFGVILFSKIINVIWSIQCATSQTALYVASLSGRLDVVLRQQMEDSCARHARKFSTIYTVIAWSVILLGTTVFFYYIFFTDGSRDLLMTPLRTHIVTSHVLVPRIIFYFFTFYLLSAHIFSQTITFVLAMIFSHQFKKVTYMLASRLDNPQRRVSGEDIERFRQKHQEISMNVDYVDDCLMFSNAAAFCCQLSCVIILLYMLTFFHSFITDLVIIIGQVFWMFTVLSGLTLMAASGITVHYYVSLFICLLLNLLLIYFVMLKRIYMHCSTLLVLSVASYQFVIQSSMENILIRKNDSRVEARHVHNRRDYEL